MYLVYHAASSLKRFFFWVGAVCVIVVVCGLFSCCIVSPLMEWWKERREDIDYRNRLRHPTVPPPNHHHQHVGLDKTRPESKAEKPPLRAPHRAKVTTNRRYSTSIVYTSIYLIPTSTTYVARESHQAKIHRPDCYSFCGNAVLSSARGKATS